MSETIDGVIFDWGGTLTPWHTIDVLAGWRVVAQLLAPDRADHVAALLDAAERAAWRSVETEQRSTTVHRIVAAAGVDIADDRLEDALRRYVEWWEPHTHTDPVVPALFAGLHERRLAVGVLSNTHWPRQWHEDIFTRDGVLELIDGAVFTSEIPWTKPHPEAFRAAMAAIGVTDPGRVVFVGDRPFDDIGGAKAVGMRAVLVPHSAVPAHDVHPDAVIDGLGDLLTVLDEWTVSESAREAAG